MCSIISTPAESISDSSRQHRQPGEESDCEDKTEQHDNRGGLDVHHSCGVCNLPGRRPRDLAGHDPILIAGLHYVYTMVYVGLCRLSF